MTDRDESSEGFLERWSRKKIDAEQKPSDPPKQDEAIPPATAGRAAENGTVAPATAPPKPEFDLASLPSLESIAAGTDIRAFLNPGVPAGIARAALRRAWAADPAIRDFVGLAENAWDFTDPTAMPGFGPLGADFDIKKLLAQVFGEVEKPTPSDAATDNPVSAQASRNAAESAPPEPSHDADRPAADGVEAQAPTAAEQQTPGEFVHRDNIAALQDSNSDVAAEEHKTRRTHGGALPQ